MSPWQHKTEKTTKSTHNTTLKTEDLATCIVEIGKKTKTDSHKRFMHNTKTINTCQKNAMMKYWQKAQNKGHAKRYIVKTNMIERKKLQK